MKATDLLLRVRHELGRMGIAALAIIAVAILFAVFFLKPLEIRNRTLERELATTAQHSASADAALARTSTPAAKIAAFYRYLATDRKAVDWLKVLHAAGEKSGVQLKSAQYRVRETGTRIERYEVSLPLRGNYAQIRAFLDTLLLDIPVLSLDEVKFKRGHAGESEVEAELRLSLHLLNS